MGEGIRVQVHDACLEARCAGLLGPPSATRKCDLCGHGVLHCGRNYYIEGYSEGDHYVERQYYCQDCYGTRVVTDRGQFSA